MLYRALMVVSGLLVIGGSLPADDNETLMKAKMRREGKASGLKQEFEALRGMEVTLSTQLKVDQAELKMLKEKAAKTAQDDKRIEELENSIPGMATRLAAITKERTKAESKHGIAEEDAAIVRVLQQKADKVEVQAVREEMKAGFKEVKDEMALMRADIAKIGKEMEELRCKTKEQAEALAKAMNSLDALSKKQDATLEELKRARDDVSRLRSEVRACAAKECRTVTYNYNNTSYSYPAYYSATPVYTYYTTPVYYYYYRPYYYGNYWGYRSYYWTGSRWYY